MNKLNFTSLKGSILTSLMIFGIVGMFFSTVLLFATDTETAILFLLGSLIFGVLIGVFIFYLVKFLIFIYNKKGKKTYLFVVYFICILLALSLIILKIVTIFA
ncbi:MAG: hypothetical protein ACOYOV_09100 [Bacteroidales bacterium]